MELHMGVSENGGTFGGPLKGIRFKVYTGYTFDLRYIRVHQYTGGPAWLRRCFGTERREGRRVQRVDVGTGSFDGHLWQRKLQVT